MTQMADHKRVLKTIHTNTSAMHDLALDLRSLDINRVLDGNKSPVNKNRKAHPLLQLFYANMSEFRGADSPEEADKAMARAIGLMQTMAHLVDRNTRELIKVEMDILKMKGRGWLPENQLEGNMVSDEALAEQAKAVGIDMDDYEDDDEDG